MKLASLTGIKTTGQTTFQDTENHLVLEETDTASIWDVGVNNSDFSISERALATDAITIRDTTNNVELGTGDLILGADNQGIVFGAGSDARIDFTGSELDIASTNTTAQSIHLQATLSSFGDGVIFCKHDATGTSGSGGNQPLAHGFDCAITMANGTAGSAANVYLNSPAFNNPTAGTISNATNLWINGVPSGTNTTFTNGPYSVYVAAGPIRLAQTAGVHTATNPTIAFGDGDSGFFENSDDVIHVATAGADRFIFNTTGFVANNATGPGLANAASTATVPTLAPNKSDTDTGIGGVAGEIDLIVNGVSQMNLDDDVVDITGRLILRQQNVTQATSSTTQVDITDGVHGTITTQSFSLASGASSGFNVATDNLHAETTVMITEVEYSGTYGTNGYPVHVVENINGVVPNGFFAIRTINMHPTNALSGTFKICYLIIEQ